MSEKSRLLKNTGLITLGNFGAKMISFILLPLYTSILSTAEYGTYDFVIAVGAFLLPVVTMCIHEAMFRFIIDTGTKGKAYDEIISNAIVSISIGMFVLAMIMGIIRYVYPSAANLLYIWIYVSANSLYTFSNYMLRGMGKIKEYAIITSSKNILQLILNVIVIVVFRWGMEGLLFSLCISELLAFFVVFFATKIWEHIHISYLSFSHIKEMIVYSAPLIANSLSSQIINMSDRLVISTFMGASANGIYSVSYKFPNMLDTLYHFFYTAWSESASRVMAKGKEEASKYYQSLYELIESFMFSVILLMTTTMPILFRIFVRGDYVNGFKYIPILLFAIYFSSISKFYSGVFTALKQTKILATSTIIAAIINVIVDIMLIKYIGLYAAAGSTLIADIILAVLRKKMVTKYIDFKMNYKKIVAECGVVIVVILLYSYNNWTNIIISIFVSTFFVLIMNKELIVALYKMILRKLG